MQIEKAPIPTAEKIRLVDMLSECEFPEIEVTSFVNPKWVPQMADAEETMRTTGSQVVGWQTGFNPVIAMELISSGAWSGSGVHAPEAFDPDPYLALLDGYGIHHAMLEMTPGAHKPT